ncbi:hypothetical protein BDW72DRAFT_200166 [Aspergillus terricola var. indicus]
MSDALCGPSNALQNFQKHASVDRTLQQDRLISRQSPSQGFRSNNPSEGILDPEFAAFESNSPVGAPLPNVQHEGHFVTPAPHMPLAHAAEAPNWAADFQNLHISGPSRAIHHQPGPSVAPMSDASQQGWHGEFLRQQQQQHRPALQENQALGQRFQPSFAPNYTMNNSSMAVYVPGPETVQVSRAEEFDESAFEAAFEQAKADMASQFEESLVETNVTESNANNKDQKEEVPAQHIAHETIRIGSDNILQVDKDDPQAAANDADELARTAGHLLNSVSHETNQKFRESNFLALMRRIRDREVQLEGDEFRETAQSLHPGGPYYPEGKRQQKIVERSWRPVGENNAHIESNDSNTISERLPSSVTSVPGIDTPTAEPKKSSELRSDHGSVYASWNHGDRWA